MEFELKFTDDSVKRIVLPNFLDFRTGQALVRAVKVKKVSKEEFDVDDATGVIAELNDVVFNRLVKHHLSVVEQEKLVFDSLTDVAGFYYDQLKGIDKKKSVTSQKSD